MDKLIGKADLAYLLAFVEDVISVCEADDTGVTHELYDLALNAKVILETDGYEKE